MENDPLWRPLEREPDPFRVAVLEAIRLSLPSAFGEARGGRFRFDGCRGRMPGGEVVLVTYVAAPRSDPPRWNGRGTIAYALGGHAARREVAHAFEGLAVVDRATRAFARLEVRFGQSDRADELGA